MSIGPDPSDDPRHLCTQGRGSFLISRNSVVEQGDATSGPEECLVFTVRPGGASYLGVEVTDPWGVRHEYVKGTGSLNNHQVRPNPDGSITYAVAGTDPGVHNWLDTRGLGLGFLTIRWQGLDAGAEMTDAVSDCRVVGTAVADELVPGQVVTPQERAEQLRWRRVAYANRL